jgi:hypothetical protein
MMCIECKSGTVYRPNRDGRRGGRCCHKSCLTCDGPRADQCLTCDQRFPYPIPSSGGKKECKECEYGKKDTCDRSLTFPCQRNPNDKRELCKRFKEHNNDACKCRVQTHQLDDLSWAIVALEPVERSDPQRRCDDDGRYSPCECEDVELQSCNCARIVGRVPISKPECFKDDGDDRLCDSCLDFKGGISEPATEETDEQKVAAAEAAAKRKAEQQAAREAEEAAAKAARAKEGEAVAAGREQGMMAAAARLAAKKGPASSPLTPDEAEETVAAAAELVVEAKQAGKAADDTPAVELVVQAPPQGAKSVLGPPGTTAQLSARPRFGPLLRTTRAPAAAARNSREPRRHRRPRWRRRTRLSLCPPGQAEAEARAGGEGGGGARRGRGARRGGEGAGEGPAERGDRGVIL